MAHNTMWLRSWIYLDQHELDLSRKSIEEFHAYGLKETAAIHSHL